MLIEAVERQIRYRLHTGEEVTLRPGVPTELPDAAARQLLKKAAGQVRVVDVPRGEPVVEPVAPNARPIYWENAAGERCGPAVPECLAKTGHGASAHFWVIVTYEGMLRWICSDRLRPTPAYDPSTPPLQPGWLVTYYRATGKHRRLCGGGEDREHGTVKDCRWARHVWTALLTDGQSVSLQAIRSVGKTDVSGQVIAAWMVEAHGITGLERPARTPHPLRHAGSNKDGGGEGRKGADTHLDKPIGGLEAS